MIIYFCKTTKTFLFCQSFTIPISDCYNIFYLNFYNPLIDNDLLRKIFPEGTKISLETPFRRPDFPPSPPKFYATVMPKLNKSLIFD